MRNGLFGLLALIASFMIFFQSCQGENQIAYARAYTSGKQLYDQHCQNCHNTNGEGLSALIPPLTDTAFVSRNRDRLACIIKHGMRDTIKVNNIEYAEPMPANHDLTDIDVAQIITYVTNSFGNNRGIYNVTQASSDLKNCSGE